MSRGDGRQVVVVGGGVIGGAAAWAFARRGWRVTLVERGAFGSEASSAAGGMLCPGAEVWDRPEHAAMFAASGRIHRAWTLELEDMSRLPVRFHAVGFLRLADTPEEAARLSDEVSSRPLAYPDLRPSFVDGADLRHAEPALAEGSPGALRFDSDALLNPVELMQALAVSLRRTGCRILEHVPAQGLIETGGRVRGVHTAEGDVEGDLTVLAAGAWSSPLLKPWLSMPLAPYKGQLMAVRAETLAVRHMVGGPATVLPRMDGTFTVGVTLEAVGFDKRPTVRALHDIYARAVATVPALETAAFERTWVGLRPGTPDEYPYLGAVPGLDGLLVGAGHFTYGVFLAPLTAEILLALAEGERPPIDLSLYRPDRFAGARTGTSHREEAHPGRSA
jgi:glycine oxidase